MNATTEPQPAGESEIVVINGRRFEVVEWDWQDPDCDGQGTQVWTLYAREVS